MARRLAEAHTARNCRLECLREVIADFFRDLVGKRGAPVEHREQQSAELQARIEIPPDQVEA